MNVIPYKGTNAIYDSIMSKDKDIIFSYDTKLAAQQFIRKIDVDIASEPIFNEAAKTIKIKPKYVPQDYSYKSVPEEFAKKIEKYEHEKIIIPDFRNSDAFYMACAGSKKMKIIVDGYSILKAEILYKRMGKIENKLRISYIEQFGSEDIPRGSVPSSNPDHIIAHLDLNGFINNELLKPTDDETYLSLVSTASTKSERLAARDRKRVDDLDIGISVEDLNDFRKLRNAVMHFRVIQTSEMKLILDIASSFDVKDFEKVLKGVI